MMQCEQAVPRTRFKVTSAIVGAGGIPDASTASALVLASIEFLRIRFVDAEIVTPSSLPVITFP